MIGTFRDGGTFSKLREGLVKGRLTIDLKRAGIGDSSLPKSSFRWKKGGRTSPQSTPSTAVSDVLRNGITTLPLNSTNTG